MTKKTMPEYVNLWGTKVRALRNRLRLRDLYEPYKALYELSWDEYGLSKKEFGKIIHTYFMTALDKAIESGNGVELFGTLGSIYIYKKVSYIWINDRLVKDPNPKPLESEFYLINVHNNTRRTKNDGVFIYYLFNESEIIKNYRVNKIRNNLHYTKNYGKNELSKHKRRNKKYNPNAT